MQSVCRQAPDCLNEEPHTGVYMNKVKTHDIYLTDRLTQQVAETTSSYLGFHILIQILYAGVQAYQAAIARVVQKKKASAGSAHVLDLGTGSGVLAVMAAKAGADTVVACDIHDSLCGVARQVGVNQ